MSASADEKLSGWRRTVAMSTVNTLIIVAVSAVKSATEQLLNRCD